MTSQRMNQKAPSYGRALIERIKAQPGRYLAALFLWSAIWTMPVLIGLVNVALRFQKKWFGDEVADDPVLEAASGEACGPGGGSG